MHHGIDNCIGFSFDSNNFSDWWAQRQSVKYKFKCEITQRKRFHLTFAFVVRKFFLISFLQFNLDIIHFHWTSFPFIHLDDEQAAIANIKYFKYRMYRIGIVVYTCFGTYINIRRDIFEHKRKRSIKVNFHTYRNTEYRKQKHIYQHNSIARNCFFTQERFPFNDYIRENFHLTFRMNEKKHKYIKSHPFTQL